MADKTPARAQSRGGARPSESRGARPSARRGQASGKRRKSSGKRLWAKILGGTVIGVLAMALVAMIAGIVFYNRTELPDPNKDFTTNTTFLYYNDGKTKLGSFAVQNRQTLPYNQMPASMKDAVVAAENRSFWTDRGVSPSGIVRSVWTIARGGEVQGGSTITQQYIKVLYLSQDRTMARKLRELALAVKVGKEVPKDKILEGYLNTIYFGRGAYGVQAASKSYFNVDAKDLTVPQAAVLSSVLNNPSIFDPSVAKGNKDRLLNRYRYVLQGMQEEGKITPAQYQQWSKALPPFPDIPINQRWGGTNGYLMKMVQNELLGKGFTQSQIDGGGLTVRTTFDPELQKRATKVGQHYKQLVGKNSSKGAAPLHPTLASVRVGTGEVQAIYGGDDYIKNTRNWALTDRPAASTFKAYATVAGLRGGLSLRSSLNGDTFTPRGESVEVRNEFRHQYGEVTLRKALAESINTAFVDMTDKIENGPAEIAKAANDAGVPKGAGWDLNGRISLGMAEVSPLDNAGGFATFANEGVHVANHVVAEVKDAKGKVVYTADTKGKQSIEEEVARDVTSALRSVVDGGTGAKVANMGFQVAGKTGTNGITRKGDNIITSAWFVATTPQISTSVMFVAGDDGNGSLDDYKRPGDNAFFGGTYPAMMWRDYMKVAMEGEESKSFPQASNVNYGQEKGQVYVPPAPRPTQTATRDAESGDGSQPTATATSDQQTSTAPTAPESQPVASQPAATTQPSQPAPTRQAPTQPAPTQPAPTQPVRTRQPAPTQVPTRMTNQPVQPTARTTAQSGNGGGANDGGGANRGGGTGGGSDNPNGNG